MAIQTLGTTRGFHTVIQGGAPDWEYYTQVRKVATATWPGRIMSGSGETEGEVDLAAAADGAAANYEIVLRRTAYKGDEQDIDTEIAVGSYVLTLRRSQDDGVGYGRFIVAAFHCGSDGTTELGEPMALEADGMLRKFAYTDGTVQTDSTIDCLTRCVETITSTTDDAIQLVYW